MFPLAARRFAARIARAPSPFLRYASTKPNAKPSIKATITEAFTEPKPPVLARWPYIYQTLQYIKYAIGFGLGYHVWCEYFFTLSLAEGISMSPTMNSTGDWLLLSKRYRHGRGIVVGDMVSYRHPIEQDSYGVKRVVGMPGDFVLRDTPGTSGMMIQIPEGHCYIVGDDLTWSRDSRMFGPLPLALVKAKVIGRLTTLDEYTWDNFADDGLKPAQLYEDEDVE